MRRLIPLAAAVALAAAPTAHAASRTIAIGAAFTPSVVVVTPGTTLIWTNGDGQAHTLTGDISSPAIKAGETYSRALVRSGQYHYTDAGNAAVKGTIVVMAKRKASRGKAVGAATRMFTGTLTVRVSEHYRFYDSDWRSTAGACNGEVGTGSRSVQMRVALPKVKYFRGRGAESLSERGARATLVRYAEQVTGNTSTSASKEVTCQDGTSTDTTADQPIDCFRDHAGRTARGTFAWSPAGTASRFEFAAPKGPSFGRCGTSYAGILDVLGVGPFALPLNLVDRRFSYSGVATSPASLREVRGIRAGLPVRIRRRIVLDFTTGCCDGYAPHGQAYSRIGSVHDVIASFDLSLRPK
jgi:plastocyanin